MLISFKMSFRVIDLTDSTYKMEARYHEFNFKTSLPGSKETGYVVLDSKDKNLKDTASAALAATMDKPFIVIISKTNRLQSVKNTDKIISGAIGNFPGIDTATKSRMENQLTYFFSFDALKGKLGMSTVIFPDTPLAIDNKWTIKTKMTSFMDANAEVDYQLADAIDKFYLIRGNGRITINETSKKQAGQPLFKYQLTGTVISDIRVNKTTGWISEIKSKQAIMGEAKALEGAVSGLAVPMIFEEDISGKGSR